MNLLEVRTEVRVSILEVLAQCAHSYSRFTCHTYRHMAKEFCSEEGGTSYGTEGLIPHWVPYTF